MEKKSDKELNKKMKTLILYETLHGSSATCARLLGERIDHTVDILRLADNENIDISLFDIIIIGGSIHMGEIHTRVKNFVQRNLDLLLKKPHGLFLVCMENGDVAKSQFENAYPEELRISSLTNGLFGGELLFKKMNLFQRGFTKKVTKVKDSISRINMKEIDRFAKDINNYIRKLHNDD